MTEEAKVTLPEPKESIKKAAKPKNATGKGKKALDALKKVGDAKKAKLDEVNPPKYREVTGRDFKNANMREFLNTDRLKNYDFTDANLSGADFTGMIVQGCKFRGANLDGAIFYNADLRWSDFTGALNIDEALFAEVDDNDIVTNAAFIKEAKGL